MFPRQLDYHTYTFCSGELISPRLRFGVKERFSTPKMLLAEERTLMTAGFCISRYLLFSCILLRSHTLALHHK